MTTELDYIPGNTIIPDFAFGISPSRLHEFISTPWVWYRTEVLGEKQFQGSTATVLGTIIHYIARCYARTQSVDYVQLYRYLLKQTIKEPDYSVAENTHDRNGIEAYIIKNNDTDIDAKYIIAQYRPMGNALIQYMRTHAPLPQRTEELIATPITDTVYACGSCDALVNERRVVDYKTTSKLTPPDKIPYNYRLQLLTYAYIYTQMGYAIDTIEIIWITTNDVGRYSEKTGKRLQDYPSEVISTRESVTKDDLEYISNMLHLVADSLVATGEHPTLTHVIWKDYRLK